MAKHKTILALAWLLYVVSEVSAGSPSSPTVQNDSRLKDKCYGPRYTSKNSSSSSRAQADSGICKARVDIFGYKCGEHHVTTNDGYILSLQRVHGRQSNNGKRPMIPVLLQHGILMDGFTWLLSSPEESLALILADEGYDVWIANSRGTKYSLGHTSLSHKDPKYWDWSWDELSAYDLPATVEYIYRNSGKQKLHYIGHSLGTLIGLAAFSQHRLLPMVRSAALLCPIAYMKHVSSPIAQVAARFLIADKLFWLGIHEFNPTGPVVHNFLCKICKFPINCFDLLTAYTGINCCLNSSSIDLFLEHEPQHTATKALIHLSQMIRDGTLTKYDYGNRLANMKHYGQPSPPAYDMSAIPDGFPIYLSYGGQDLLSVTRDVLTLAETLKSHGRSNLMVQYVPNYAHADFVVAVNAKEVVYAPMIQSFLKRY